MHEAETLFSIHLLTHWLDPLSVTNLKFSTYLKSTLHKYTALISVSFVHFSKDTTEFSKEVALMNTFATMSGDGSSELRQFVQHTTLSDRSGRYSNADSYLVLGSPLKPCFKCAGLLFDAVVLEQLREPFEKLGKLLNKCATCYITTRLRQKSGHFHIKVDFFSNENRFWE